MRAAVVAAAGEPPECAEFADPPAEEGREIVALVAAGIHPIVRSLVAGTHYGSTGDWPAIPGVDAVARTADGRLVYTGYAPPPYGTLAERISVPAGFGVPLPDGADPVAVAGGLNPGMSSWVTLRTRAAEGPLGTVLVLGATGCAGMMAVQNAPLCGAERVVAVGRDGERLRRAAELGATATVALRGERDADAAGIAAGLDGSAPSLVLDYLWGAPAEAAFRALERRGLDEDEADIRYVEIGGLAGLEAAVPASLLRSRRLVVSGSGAGSGSVADVVRELPGYIAALADGRVTTSTRAFPLERVREAWGAAATPGERAVVVP